MVTMLSYRISTDARSERADAYGCHLTVTVVSPLGWFFAKAAMRVITGI